MMAFATQDYDCVVVMWYFVVSLDHLGGTTLLAGVMSISFSSH